MNRGCQTYATPCTQSFYTLDATVQCNKKFANSSLTVRHVLLALLARKPIANVAVPKRIIRK